MSQRKNANFTELSNKQLLGTIATFMIPLILFFVFLSIGFVAEGSQQFSNLADAFDHGQTNFLQSIGGMGQDPVLYHGKIFWDEGAFPAVILMPFVAIFNLFHHLFLQGYIKWVFVLGISLFIYKLAKKFKFETSDSLFLVLTFCLSSVFMGVNSVSSGWLYAQVVNTFLMFWALYEYYFKKRWWLIGIICAFILLTRITAAPLVIFFGISILMNKGLRGDKLKYLGFLLLPIVVGFLLISAYNYQRFGNPLNNGNQYQLLSQDSVEARSLGLFSFDHIPTNLYTALLRGPNIVTRDSTSWTLKFPYIRNNPLGISVFLTSPYLLYMFMVRWKKYPVEAKWLIIAAGVSAIFVLSYFGDGSQQFGYRYSLDFFPEIFVAFMLLYRKYHKNLTLGLKTLVILSCIFNFYLICTYIQ